MDSEDSLRSLFVKDKPVNAVMALRSGGKLNARDISEAADTTYSHAVRVLNKLEDEGVLESEKEGRSKNYSLTEKGASIADGLAETFDIKEKHTGLERSL